jgi:hypothetical protein
MHKVRIPRCFFKASVRAKLSPISPEGSSPATDAPCSCSRATLVWVSAALWLSASRRHATPTGWNCGRGTLCGRFTKSRASPPPTGTRSSVCAQPRTPLPSGRGVCHSRRVIRLPPHSPSPRPHTLPSRWIIPETARFSKWPFEGGAPRSKTRGNRFPERPHAGAPRVRAVATTKRAGSK